MGAIRVALPFDWRQPALRGRPFCHGKDIVFVGAHADPGERRRACRTRAAPRTFCFMEGQVLQAMRTGEPIQKYV